MDKEKIKSGIKRFFSNPNTVTFLLVLILIVIVYFVYNTMVNKAIAPVSVPYCTQQIKAMKEVTEESVGTVQISGNFITANGSGLLQAKRNVVGKYVRPGYQIAENSFFYSDALADESIQEKTAFSDIPDGYTIYPLETTFEKTYASSIMPGNRIDLYFKANDPEDEDRLIFGLFIKSIEVLKVVDKDGYDVFTESSKEEPEPKYIYFAVPDEYFTFLNIIQKANGAKMEAIPVPRNAGYTENPEPTTMVNDFIEGFILQYGSTMN